MSEVELNKPILIIETTKRVGTLTVVNIFLINCYGLTKNGKT